MKAIILSAGRGERLKPLTDSIPKVMVSINNKPVLQHNIEWLKKYGVTDFIVNLHYLPEIIKNYFGSGIKFGVNITYLYEKEILGTSGAIKNAERYLKEPFLVVYGDNINTIDLYKFRRFHEEKKGIGTIALHKREFVKNSGVVCFDKDRRITEFVEKPKKDVGCEWVNAGLYLLEPEFIRHIPEAPTDFGRDIFPKVLKRGQRLYGYPMFFFEHVYWLDTPEDLEYTRMLMKK